MDCTLFAPAADGDPKFTAALRHAFNHGVEDLCYDRVIDVEGVSLRRRMDWSLL